MIKLFKLLLIQYFTFHVSRLIDYHRPVPGPTRVIRIAAAQGGTSGRYRVPGVDGLQKKLVEDSSQKKHKVATYRSWFQCYLFARFVCTFYLAQCVGIASLFLTSEVTKRYAFIFGSSPCLDTLLVFKWQTLRAFDYNSLLFLCPRHALSCPKRLSTLWRAVRSVFSRSAADCTIQERIYYLAMLRKGLQHFTDETVHGS